jgi:hypothetical protein
MAETAALSPSSFPQSSTGLFDVISVISVLARSYRRMMISSSSSADGQIMALRANCGKKHWEEPSSSADHHGSEIATRSKERWKSGGSPHGQPHHGHTGDDGNGNEECDGMALVVIQLHADTSSAVTGAE